MRELDLPLDEAPLGRTLVWLMAGLVFLAVIAAALSVTSLAKLRGLSREPLLVTVALPPPRAPDDAEAAEALVTVISELRGLPGIAYVEPIPRDELGKLVEPWIDDGALRDALPMPRLVDAAFNSGVRPDLASLEQRLQALVPGTTIGETSAFRDTRIELFRSWALVAGILAGVTLLLAVVAVVVVTRINLRLQNDGIELLRLMGADDPYLSRQFELHALSHALRGAVFGFGAAAAVVVTLVHGKELLELASGMDATRWPVVGWWSDAVLGSFDWLTLAATPLLLSLLVVVAVRLTARIGLMRHG